jgi:hypothetical protein
LFRKYEVDYISSRLLAFRDEHRWLLLFNSITWCPAGEGLTKTVKCVGNCVKGRQGFDGDRSFITGKITEQIHDDEIVNSYSVIIRGKSISISELEIIAHPDLYSDRKSIWLLHRGLSGICDC